MADTAVEAPKAAELPKDVATEKSDVKAEDVKTEEKDDKSRSNGRNQPDRRDRDRRNRGDERSDRRGPPKNRQWKQNIKTNYDNLPESSDPFEIRKQVEFYFSDSNLAYDDYMNSLVGGAENKSVPISVIHSFKRMRRFQPFSAVVAALKESETLDVLEGDELRRKVAWSKPEVDGEMKDPTIPRSIYAKGFGEEGQSTQFDIETLFAPYGPINSVRLRRKIPSREFKGSVFVEFETEEGQKEFMDLEDKPKFEGKELQYMSKQEYCEMKLKDIEAGKLAPNKKEQYKQYAPRNANYNGNGQRKEYGRDRGDRRNDRGGRDKDRKSSNRRDKGDWKGRRDDFQRNGYRSPKGEKDEDKEASTEAGADDVKENPTETVDSKKRDREEDVSAEGEKSPKKAKPEEVES